ncbi:fumarylacetoacetate hydrolase family protein [Zunongwangia endophytica]|uniref:Fumarylacetoacetate hydrolase family protein n=1 Tax=Zunongwangia endophytica TaxID=1808945 RepID=A0ABV8H8N5_9FLAO|nr:fumarylacetoacetate hydrolase family protein [Zunongwangia endophytica]MDN3594872.1 fumarylacetoacetate hydrolase family protein [Zunongwangia endophytica]
MKLIRFGEAGEEKPGVELEDGMRLDVSGFGADYDDDFFGKGGIHKLEAWLKSNKSSCEVIPPDIRLGPPVKKPSKLICIGLNYAKHAEESGATIPDEPVIFFKATSAIVGPNDKLIIPKGSQKTDWEVELAIVIEKKANYVSKDEAMDYVAGYVLHNDYSEREFQLERSGQWVKGKSCDTFAPLGPYLITKDEISDPQNLGLWLKLNGEIKQQSNTNDMVFGISEIVSYLSQFMSLMPGDIISTGTPFGVGMGLKPQRYIKPGDTIELGIEGLGASKQHAVAWEDFS